eukprot:scaffold27229_cov36-Prasinocladus_malaysianus.AAC.1
MIRPRHLAETDVGSKGARTLECRVAAWHWHLYKREMNGEGLGAEELSSMIIEVPRLFLANGNGSSCFSTDSQPDDFSA